MSRGLTTYGLCFGILVFGIVYIMTCALEKANIVILITQISSILTFLPGGLFLKTRFGPLKIAGAVLGTGGILLLSCTEALASQLQ